MENRRLEMQRVTDLLWKPPAVPGAALSPLRRGGRSDAGHVLLHFAEPGSDVPAPLRVTHLRRGWGVLPVLPGSGKVPGAATGQGTERREPPRRSGPAPALGRSPGPRGKRGQDPCFIGVPRTAKLFSPEAENLLFSKMSAPTELKSFYRLPHSTTSFWTFYQ